MDWLFTFADPTIDWNYAMITLLVRFIGVFFVMAAMQIALQVSSRVIRRIEAPVGAAPAPAAGVASSAPSEAATVAAAAEDGVDELTAAAIGLALALEARPPTGAADAGTTSWAAAGRIQQLNRLPR